MKRMMILLSLAFLVGCHEDDTITSVGGATFNYSTGTLDATFDSDGIVTTDIQAAGDVANAMVLQSDGKLVVAGYSYDGSNNDWALARYNTDGTLDTTFDSDGKVTLDQTYGGKIHAVAMQMVNSVEKIVVAGEVVLGGSGAETDSGLARYNLDGTLDTTFNGTGTVITSMDQTAGGDDEFYAIAVDSNNKILVAGRSWNGQPFDLSLARYNSDGSLDNTFDGDGKVFVTSGSTAIYLEVYEIVLQSDGKILVAGHYMNGSSADFAAFRFEENGALDTTFDGDGMVLVDFGGNSDLGKSVALQSDGKIIVAGSSNGNGLPNFALVRLNSDGSLDTSFDGDGKLFIDMGGINEATSVAVQSDGMIVVAGFSYDFSTYKFAVARCDTSGALDSSFGTDGKVITTVGSTNSEGEAVLLHMASSGSVEKILVAGYADNGSGNDFAVVRYE